MRFTSRVQGAGSGFRCGFSVWALALKEQPLDIWSFEFGCLSGFLGS